jgi:hypothetical protein
MCARMGGRVFVPLFAMKFLHLCQKNKFKSSPPHALTVPIEYVLLVNYIHGPPEITYGVCTLTQRHLGLMQV